MATAKVEQLSSPPEAPPNPPRATPTPDGTPSNQGSISKTAPRAGIFKPMDSLPPSDSAPAAAPSASSPAAESTTADPAASVAPPAAAAESPPPTAASAAPSPSAGEGSTMNRDLSITTMLMDISIPSAASIGKIKGPTPPPTLPPEVVKEPAKHPVGVLSVFVTDVTCEIMGLDKEEADHESLHLVSAKKILEDIETRGKASDFFKLKSQLKNYWEEMFTIRYITDDRYLNGHNFEIYATYDSREKLLADIQTAIKVHEELFGPKHWENLGSDIEVEAEMVKMTRPLICMRAARKHKEFYTKVTLKDREAMETWSSSQMECRPFKDPSFEKYFSEQDVGCSAISILKYKAVQTIQERARNSFAQYEFREFDPETKKRVVGSEDLAAFLRFSRPLWLLRQHLTSSVFVSTPHALCLLLMARSSCGTSLLHKRWSTERTRDLLSIRKPKRRVKRLFLF